MLTNLMLLYCPFFLDGPASAFRKRGEYRLPESKLESCMPVTRGEHDTWWLPRHEGQLGQPGRGIVFLGDSITACWIYPAAHRYPGGLESWERHFAASAANFGIPGDGTQHILWRLTEGDCLRDYKADNPELVILLAGVNNLRRLQDTPENTAEGIKIVAGCIRKILPGSRLLLLGILPNSENPDDPAREKTRGTNDLISSLGDEKFVFYRDIGDVFIEDDGTISKAIMRDYVHLTPKGYELFACTLIPIIEEITVKQRCVLSG